MEVVQGRVQGGLAFEHSSRVVQDYDSGAASWLSKRLRLLRTLSLPVGRGVYGAGWGGAGCGKEIGNEVYMSQGTGRQAFPGTISAGPGLTLEPAAPLSHMLVLRRNENKVIIMGVWES